MTCCIQQCTETISEVVCLYAKLQIKDLKTSRTTNDYNIKFKKRKDEVNHVY